MKKTIAVIVTLAAALATLVLAPPVAAVTPSVSITSSATKVNVGNTVTIRVSVWHGAPGQKVTLLKRQGTTWKALNSKYLPRTGTVKRVGFTPRLTTVGFHTFRVKIWPKGRYEAVWSKSITVRAATPLRFNFSGAAGLAIRLTNASARTTVSARTSIPASNFIVVTSSGEIRQAVTSGDAIIQDFLISPTGEVYVLFSQRVHLSDTTLDNGSGCLLAEIDPDSGWPRCVDSSLDSIAWHGGSPIQFDSSGAIYYLGYSGSTQVLRRYSQGSTRDYNNSNIRINSWKVLSNGWTLLAGETLSTGIRWTRALNPDGGLVALYGAGHIGENVWGDLFPDGNFYFYETSCQGPGGLRRFDATSHSKDPTFWIRPVLQTGAVVSAECDGPRSVYFAPLIGDRYTTPDGRVVSYRFVNNGWKALQIARVFPTPPQADGGNDFDGYGGRSLTDDGFLEQDSVFSDAMTLAAPVGSSILFAGIDQGFNKLVEVDLNAWQYSELALPEEIEFYHFAATTDGKALFDGLRFSDNKVVIGEVDLTTNSVTVLGLLASKWEDFQTFESPPS